MKIVQNFWDPAKRKHLLRLLLAGLVLIPVVSIWVPVPSQTSVLRLGDYITFYSAAKILKEESPAGLYDWDLQQKIQQPYLEEGQGFSPFAYPPFVALLFYPAALVPPYLGKWIFVVLLALALTLALITAQRYTEGLKGNLLEGLAFFGFFFPVSLGILGAQNVALSMLLYAAAFRALTLENKKGDFCCGLALGAWLFKPHYPLLMLFLLLLARRWHVLAGFSLVAALYYVLGALLMGLAWPLVWLQAALEFSKADFVVNADHMINLNAILYAAGKFLFLDSSKTEILIGAGGGLALVIFFWLAAFFFRSSGAPSPERRERIFRGMALAGPVSLLISPHTLFYDIGIAALACCPYLKIQSRQDMTKLLLILMLCNVFTAARLWLPFQPLFLGLVASVFFILRGTRNG